MARQERDPNTGRFTRADATPTTADTSLNNLNFEIDPNDQIRAPRDSNSTRYEDYYGNPIGVRMSKSVRNALGIAGTVAILGLAGTGVYALVETGKNAGSPKTTESTQLQRPTTETTGQAAGGVDPKPQGVDATTTPVTPTTVFESGGASTTTTKVTEQSPASQEGGISLPTKVSGDLARSLKEGGNFAKYTEGQWFLPVYNEAHANAKFDWEGIGPWCPEFFRNIDAGAAHLGTHGMPGETIITADNGGMVEFGIMQLGPHQNDGLMNGNGDFNPNWSMQYTFKGLIPFQEVIPFDPDTGKQLTKPDGSPIVFAASKAGDFSVEIPKTDGTMDVRVAFKFDMVASDGGSSVQAHEVKVERGPNDNPGKTGENHLPKDQVIKAPAKS